MASRISCAISSFTIIINIIILAATVLSGECECDSGSILDVISNAYLSNLVGVNILYGAIKTKSRDRAVGVSGNDDASKYLSMA